MDYTKMKQHINDLSSKEKAQRRYSIAIKDKGHLKDFLENSGRSWVVFKSSDLVEALSFPEDIQEFMRIVDLYGRYRCTSPSGRTEKVQSVDGSETWDVPIPKSDVLEVEELDQVIRFLVGQITEKKSDWSLEDPPL